MPPEPALEPNNHIAGPAACRKARPRPPTQDAPATITAAMSAPPAPSPAESRRKTLGCLALLLVALYLLLGPRLDLHHWTVSPAGNTAFEEALAWKKGRLDLTLNDYEVARVGDKRYNVVGLAFTLISLAATSLNNLAGGIPDDFFQPWYIAVVALPLPLLGFWAFRTVTASAPLAALLTAALLVGTSLEPVLRVCQGGSIYYINHALAVSGLLLFAGDLLGRRRVWPALIGLALAAWSRQMTALYAIPFLWIVLRPPAPRRRVLALTGLALIAALPMTLSGLKFGNPFDSGYSRIYEGRRDPIGRMGQQAVFSPDYIRMHLAAMNWNIPRWDIRGGALMPDTDGLDGAAIWLTTPLLLGVFTTFRSWWSDPVRRALMLGTLPVIAGLSLYHTTGSLGAGHYRYALDYIPVWLLVIAPGLKSPRALPWLLACLAWSALYFRLMP